MYGDKDADGFYRGETCARLGLIPCNMVSEIQADDEEMMDQLLLGADKEILMLNQRKDTYLLVSRENSERSQDGGGICL